MGSSSSKSDKVLPPARQDMPTKAAASDAPDSVTQVADMLTAVQSFHDQDEYDGGNSSRPLAAVIDGKAVADGVLDKLRRSVAKLVRAATVRGSFLRATSEFPKISGSGGRESWEIGVRRFGNGEIWLQSGPGYSNSSKCACRLVKCSCFAGV